MPTFLDPLVDISPVTTGSWQTVDVSAYCPAGTTGVIIRYWSTSSTNYAFGYRKKGSADNRTGNANGRLGGWIGCGVDANRQLEIYIANAALKTSLVGYFGAEAVFFTNGINKSVGGTGSWQDVSIAANVNVGDSAVLAFLEFSGLSGSWQFGVRKKGSTLGTPNTLGLRGGAAGLDATLTYQNYIENLAQDVYLLGYLRAGAVVHDTVQVVTPGSTGNFVDLAALPAGAIGGFYRLYGGISYPAGIRCKGAAETTYNQLNDQTYVMVKCDGSQLVEAKIANTTQNVITELGYFTDLPTPAITNLSSASGYVGDSVTITGTGFNASQGTGSVTFNGAAATITSWTDTSIVCTVPAGATTGNIVVTNLWGNASTGTAYTVKNLPTVTATPETPIHTGNPVGAGPNIGLSPVR